MEENKDKKITLAGKLQLKKTFNAGQIKQNFSHGRSKSVSVEVKKKRTFSTINKKFNDDQSVESEVLKEEPDDIKRINPEIPKAPKEGIRDLNVKHPLKKPTSKPTLEPKKIRMMHNKSLQKKVGHQNFLRVLKVLKIEDKVNSQYPKLWIMITKK